MGKGAKSKWSPEELKAQFEQVAEPKNNTSAKFVKYADLKRLWNTVPQGEKDTRLVLLLRRYVLDAHKIPARLEEKLRKDYLRIISTLVYISWTRWSDLRKIFIDSGNISNSQSATARDDTAIPFALEVLESSDFLHKYGLTFYDAQFFFSPITIRYETISKSHKCSRMPIISSKKIGEGASGNVFEELIAPGYIEVTESHDLNTTAKAVARKSILAKDSFHGESDNVSHLQSGLSTHRAITRSLGMIIREDDHETRFDIFYELASFDLRRFLNGPDSAEGYLDHFNFHPDHYCDFNAGHLLEQMAYLADALRHLHEGLILPSMGTVCLAHNDFKPENILIFHSTLKQYPAGIWKIADFGLSNIKQDKANSAPTKQSYLALAPRDVILQVSPTVCRRNPAGYSAPEIERQGAGQIDGRESDVWSFGCVVSLVLAHCLGHTNTVRELNGLRMNDRDDRFYEKSSESRSGFKVKASVFDWLTDLPRKYSVQGDWIQQSVVLIFDIFRVAPTRDSLKHGDLHYKRGHISGLTGRPTGKVIRDRIYQLIRENVSKNWNVERLLPPESMHRPHRPYTPPPDQDATNYPGSAVSSREAVSVDSRNPLADRYAETSHYEDYRENGGQTHSMNPIQSSHLTPERNKPSLYDQERTPNSIASRRKPVPGLGIDLGHAIPKLITPESPITGTSVEYGQQISTEPDNISPTHKVEMVLNDRPRSESAATVSSSGHQMSPPIRLTNSAPDNAVPCSSRTTQSPGSVRSSGSRTDSRQSSLVPDPHPISRITTQTRAEPSARVKFANENMTHTRLSPDGKYVAFWLEKPNKKVLICHLSFPSHYWNREARLLPMAQYTGLSISPPKDYACATVAVAGNWAAIHFKTKGDVEIQVYTISSMRDHHRCDGVYHSSFRYKELAGLLDISMTVNGILVMRFLDHVRVGFVDQEFSSFKRSTTAGKTENACMTPDGGWLTILAYDQLSQKQHWYVRDLPRAGQDPSTFKGWMDSGKESNHEKTSDRPCSAVALNNAMARFYISGSATIHQNIANDRRGSVKLHSQAIACASMTPDGTSLIYVGVGTNRKSPTIIGSVPIRTGPDNRISMEAPFVLAELQTSWRDWDDGARHFALGEAWDANGMPALFAFVSSADGTVERVQLTNNDARTGSMPFPPTPDALQKDFPKVKRGSSTPSGRFFGF